MTYYIRIFGCQMNYSDAERISTILEKNKSKSASSIDEADLIVFVTCGVRQSAENRVYGQIHNIQKNCPKKTIVLTGCLAHRKDVQRRLKNKVDLFATIENFTKEIKKILYTKYQIPNTKASQYDDYLDITPKYANPYTAYVPIMTGCNNFCSYCVVPYARGREYSRPAEDILREVKTLIKKGYKEIILLGQNVNSYKSKIQNTSYKILATKEQTISFADLLKLINAIPGKFWISFLTSHPKDMSDELIKTISKSKKVCEYVSLPAQSGDDNILRKMDRKYTVKHYKNLIKKIRKVFLDVQRLRRRRWTSTEYLPPVISTDIIVGFPGETKKQFENTAKLLRETKFDMAYVSQYSPRPETAAWKMKNSVSKKEKVRRDKVLTEILKITALENNKKYVGKVVEALVERVVSSPQMWGSRNFKLDSRFRGNDNEERGIKYQGHTKNQKKVIFSSNKKIPVGSFQKVKITKAKAFGLEGELA